MGALGAWCDVLRCRNSVFDRSDSLHFDLVGSSILAAGERWLELFGGKIVSLQLSPKASKNDACIHALQ